MKQSEPEDVQLDVEAAAKEIVQALLTALGPKVPLPLGTEEIEALLRRVSGKGADNSHVACSLRAAALAFGGDAELEKAVDDGRMNMQGEWLPSPAPVPATLRRRGRRGNHEFFRQDLRNGLRADDGRSDFLRYRYQR